MRGSEKDPKKKTLSSISLDGLWILIKVVISLTAFEGEALRLSLLVTFRWFYELIKSFNVDLE